MDEEGEILEAKTKIDKEVGELEAQLAVEQENLDFNREFFSDDSQETKAIIERITLIEKNLIDWIELKEFGKQRLFEIQRKKQEELAKKHYLERARTAMNIDRFRFINNTRTMLITRFKQKRAQHIRIINGLFIELLKNPDPQNRKEMRELIQKWLDYAKYLEQNKSKI